MSQLTSWLENRPWSILFTSIDVNSGDITNLNVCFTPSRYSYPIPSELLFADETQD